MQNLISGRLPSIGSQGGRIYVVDERGLVEGVEGPIEGVHCDHRVVRHHIASGRKEKEAMK